MNKGLKQLPCEEGLQLRGLLHLEKAMKAAIMLEVCKIMPNVENVDREK